jgi:hypothetical protein
MPLSKTTPDLDLLSCLRRYRVLSFLKMSIELLGGLEVISSSSELRLFKI